MEQAVIMGGVTLSQVRPGPHQIFKISNVTAIFPGHVLCKIFKRPHQNLKANSSHGCNWNCTVHFSTRQCIVAGVITCVRPKQPSAWAALVSIARCAPLTASVDVHLETALHVCRYGARCVLSIWESAPHEFEHFAVSLSLAFASLEMRQALSLRLSLPALSAGFLSASLSAPFSRSLCVSLKV